jgi:Ca2+-binding RTX toxin-like protein
MRWKRFASILAVISLMALPVLMPAAPVTAQVYAVTSWNRIAVETLVAFPLPARPDGPRARPECTIVGTAGDDQPLEGTQHDDVICGRGGDDWVLGEEGNDTLFLGRGDDSAGGGPGDDVIRGGAGKDYGEGGYGNDRIYLGRDKDEVIDYHGMDVVSGGPGDDWCLNVRDGHGGDVIRGGPGRDVFYIDDGDQVFSAEVTSKPGSYMGCG